MSMRRRILVIDDEEAIRKSFVLALEDSEYHVDTAESGEKGVEMALISEYDLVFLDLKMPGLDGVATLRQMRRINEDVPVYIITAFHEEFFDQLKSLQEDGIDFEVFRKPMAIDQIVLITDGILNGPKEIGYAR